jgi:hypothetical protein
MPIDRTEPTTEEWRVWQWSNPRIPSEKLRLIVVAEGYVMVDRPGFMPWVLGQGMWEALERAENV